MGPDGRGQAQPGRSIKDWQGYTLRKMKLKASAECVTERITISEATGTITYSGVMQMEARLRHQPPPPPHPV